MLIQLKLWLRSTFWCVLLVLTVSLQSCSIKDGDAMGNTNFILANQLFFDALDEGRIEIFTMPVAKPTILHVDSYTVVLRPLRLEDMPKDHYSDNFVELNHHCLLTFVCYSLDKNIENSDKSRKTAIAIIGLMSNFDRNLAALANLIKTTGVNGVETQKFIQSYSSQYLSLKKDYGKEADQYETVTGTLNAEGEIISKDELPKNSSDTKTNDVQPTEQPVPEKEK